MSNYRYVFLSINKKILKMKKERNSIILISS